MLKTKNNDLNRDINSNKEEFKKLLRSCIVLEDHQLEDIANCFISDGWIKCNK